jgi:hypothetical protein
VALKRKNHFTTQAIFLPSKAIPFKGMELNMNKTQFLWLATVFEGGLIGLSFLCGLWLEINPLASISLNAEAISLGLLGTLGLLVAFGGGFRLPIPELQRIRRLLIETLGEVLAACRWYELVYVAVLAGIGEESLFRGVLQPWMEELWGRPVALIVTNLLFGLAHSVTPLYTALAALTGLYLGWLLDAGGERNLFVPMFVHASYDLAAFFLVAATYRAEYPR